MAEREKLIDGEVTTSVIPSTERSIQPGDATLFWESLPRPHHGPTVAVVLLILVIAFLILIVFLDIPLKHPGELATYEHMLYVTGTTILASLISAFVSGQIRLLWTARILDQAASTDDEHSIGFARVGTLLGIGTMRNQLHFWSSSGSMLLVGLITTAIVAGITPSISQVEQLAPISLYPNDIEPCFYKSNQASNDSFSWSLPDGTFLSYNTSTATDFLDRCTIQYAPTIFANIPYVPISVSDYYAYQAGGVPVSRTALGTLFDYSRGGAGFESALGAWTGHLLQRITACIPVLVRNPVRCHKAGNLTVGPNEIRTTANGCTVKSPIFSVDPTTQPASSLGVCTGNVDVGKATIVIGTVNEHATLLAQTMRDPNMTQSASGPLSYVVACAVDIAPSIEFRSVTYSRPNQNISFDLSDVAFTVDGSGEVCTPETNQGPTSISSIITNGTLAYGAAVSYPLLMENAYRDGWWPTLYEAANGGVAPTQSTALVQYIGQFNDSLNPLEDKLGLASAIVLSMYWAMFLDTPESALEESIDLKNGRAYLSGVRVGSGRLWALTYIAPEIYALGLLLYLIQRK